MAEVNLAIHGKSYGIACDDGQEQRVTEVGRYVDTRARDIAAAGAASNETHLLVLTALVLADEVKELQETMKVRSANVNGAAYNGAANGDAARVAEEERRICDAISQLTTRLDSVASRLSNI